jgi:hypothetical protein
MLDIFPPFLPTFSNQIRAYPSDSSWHDGGGSSPLFPFMLISFNCSIVFVTTLYLCAFDSSSNINMLCRLCPFTQVPNQFSHIYWNASRMPFHQIKHLPAFYKSHVQTKLPQAGS